MSTASTMAHMPVKTVLAICLSPVTWLRPTTDSVSRAGSPPQRKLHTENLDGDLSHKVAVVQQTVR